MPDRATRIRSILTQSFQPLRLDVVDDSARHAGHAGAAPGGETHFSILLVSEMFRTLGRVERSRAVHAALEREFGDGLHALALSLKTPEEMTRVK